MKRGKFDAYSPEKLQEILESIQRKDLANAAKEYKQSSLFKEEMKRRKKINSTHSSRMHKYSQSAKRAEKCLDALGKTLMHMSTMIEQTTSLISSVEVFMEDNSKKEEAQASITETKTKMKELSKAINETATEIQGNKEHQLQGRAKGCTQVEKFVVGVQRTSIHSDGKPTYIAVPSPTMRLKPLAWSKQAMMTMWTEISHKKEQWRRSNHSSSDGGSRESSFDSTPSKGWSRDSSFDSAPSKGWSTSTGSSFDSTPSKAWSRGSSIDSILSSEDTSGEERYVSTEVGRKNCEENVSTSETVDSPEEHVYDDPDIDSTRRKLQRVPYINVIFEQVESEDSRTQPEGEEVSRTQPKTPDSQNCYENVTFVPVEQQNH